LGSSPSFGVTGGAAAGGNRLRRPLPHLLSPFAPERFFVRPIRHHAEVGEAPLDRRTRLRDHDGKIVVAPGRVCQDAVAGSEQLDKAIGFYGSRT
jgi:hypothetical protein